MSGATPPPDPVQVLRGMAGQRNVGSVRAEILKQAAAALEREAQRVVSYTVFGRVPGGMMTPRKFSAPEREQALALADKHNLTCLEETVRLVRQVRGEEETSGEQ